VATFNFSKKKFVIIITVIIIFIVCRQIVANVVLLGLAGLCVSCLCLNHCQYVCTNRTTLEDMKGTERSKYDLGCCENTRSVMGDYTLLWCLPCIWGVSFYDGIRWNGRTPVVNSSV